MEKKNTKIYIISGKARHGKDTVATMIKEYYEKNNKNVINLQFSSYIKEYAKQITDWDGSEETKPRELLQQLGTEIIRGKIDEEFFIKRIISDIQVYEYFYDVITISDARFKIELDAIKKEFPTTCCIHIVRPNFDNGLTESQKNHPTEIDLDDYQDYDYDILNDSNINDLEEKTISIIEGVNCEH